MSHTHLSMALVVRWQQAKLHLMACWSNVRSVLFDPCAISWYKLLSSAFHSRFSVKVKSVPEQGPWTA